MPCPHLAVGVPCGSPPVAVSSPSFLGAPGGPFGLTRRWSATPVRPEGGVPPSEAGDSGGQLEGADNVNRPQLVAWCVAPGGQPVLFRLPTDRVPTFVVVDRDGTEQVHTSSLGVAVTVARQVLIEQGEVWVRASDDTCAHIDLSGVASDTPECPWIRTVAASLEGVTE